MRRETGPRDLLFDITTKQRQRQRRHKKDKKVILKKESLA